MISTPIREAIDDIIGLEGGFVDDPADSGGATRWGITEHTARENGYTGPMASLPRDLAVEIFTKRYFVAPHFDRVADISIAVAHELLEAGILAGPRVATVYLQRALSALGDPLKADGAVGPTTLFHLRTFVRNRGAAGINVLLIAMNCLQGAALIELAERREKDKRFIYGWLDNRITLTRNIV